MAHEIGGRADKFGNRFENNWVISKLLDVIEERVSFIILEALGEDEEGVDLWVGYNNGISFVYGSPKEVSVNVTGFDCVGGIAGGLFRYGFLIDKH